MFRSVLMQLCSGPSLLRAHGWDVFLTYISLHHCLPLLTRPSIWLPISCSILGMKQMHLDCPYEPFHLLFCVFIMLSSLSDSFNTSRCCSSFVTPLSLCEISGHSVQTYWRALTLNVYLT